MDFARTSHRRPLIVIEHLEPKLSKWLLIEYRHSALIAGSDLLITNVCRREEAEILSKTVKTTCESASELFERAVVLDPQAKELLSPEDRELSEVFVIGGILGDHPPRGRTKELITKKMKNPIPRSLGDKQFSIDGAVYMVYKVIFEKVPLKDIPYVDGVILRSGDGFIEHEIILPYRYPIVDGKPLIHQDLLKYLRARITVDENRLITGE